MTRANSSRRAQWARPAGVAAAAAVLVGAGALVGTTWLANGRPAVTAGSATSAPAAPTATTGSGHRPEAQPAGAKAAGNGAAGVIEMAKATGVVCRGPVTPGPGHPDRLLSQLFNVSDGSHAYLLGWQIVPYRGIGTYRLATAGNLLALEPATGGSPLGFGKGTVTFFAGARSGSVDAVVTMKSGPPVKVRGPWQCS